LAISLFKEMNVTKFCDQHVGNPITPVAETDLAWMIPKGTHTETQTLYCTLDADAFFFVQIAHANFGLGDNVQYTYRYYDRATKTSIFRSNNLSGLELSDKNASSRSGPVTFKHLGDHAYEISISKPDTVTIVFKPSCASYKLGSGRAAFGSGADAPYIGHAYTPRGTVTGSITTKGKAHSLDGTGFFVHAIQRDRPYNVAAKWNFAVLHSPRITLHLMEFQTPVAWNSEWVAQSALVVDNVIQSATPDAHMEPAESVQDPESGYAPPTKMAFTWKGALSSGGKFEAKVNVPDPQLAGKIDLLAQLPWLLRKIIQAVVTKPYNYQWYDHVDVDVTLFDADNNVVETIHEKAQLVHEVTFMN
jgi:hypothetical protein